VAVKDRTAIKALVLYFDLSLSVKWSGRSCLFTTCTISSLTN